MWLNDHMLYFYRMKSFPGLILVCSALISPYTFTSTFHYCPQSCEHCILQPCVPSTASCYITAINLFYHGRQLITARERKHVIAYSLALHTLTGMYIIILPRLIHGGLWPVWGILDGAIPTADVIMHSCSVGIMGRTVQPTTLDYIRITPSASLSH